jgi:hypothetical protein
LNAQRSRHAAVLFTVLLAAAMWYITFALGLASFWIKISLSASTLAVISLMIQPRRAGDFRFNRRAILLGAVSAAVLYGIFWVGKTASAFLFDFAGRQIGGIYAKGLGTPSWAIAILLFGVTGPSEEIYWRGFLQHHLMQRFGRWPGWGLATAVYAGVHIFSMNFMLVGAAAVAGAFWGALYARWGNLAPVIVSHSLWSTVIFAVLPMGPH